MQVEYRTEGNYLSGLLWFILMAVLVGWIPLLGPFLVGFVAGRKSGGVGTALLVVLTPTVIIAVLTAALITQSFGAEAGGVAGGVVAILVGSYALIEVSGALVGAATASPRPYVHAAASAVSQAPAVPEVAAVPPVAEIPAPAQGTSARPAFAMVTVAGLAVLAVIAVVIVANWDRLGSSDDISAANDGASSDVTMTGRWFIQDTITYGPGTGNTFSFYVTFSGGDGVSQGSGDGLNVTAVGTGTTVDAHYVQDGGYSGDFTWTLAGEGDTMTGTFTNSRGNGGTSTATRVE